MSKNASSSLMSYVHRLGGLGLMALLMLGQSPVVAAAEGKPKPAIAAQPPADKAWVKVEGAWIRPTVPGQTATGGFMQLTASQPLVLVGFSSPAASEAEVHEMAMEGDVMRMRAITSLELPAGKTVSLQPGRHHLMLMGLKQPLKAGELVPLTLKLRTTDGKTVTQDIKADVRAAMPMHGAMH